MQAPLLAIHSHAQLVEYEAAVMRSKSAAFYYGGSGTVLAYSSIGALGVSMHDSTAGGLEKTIASGTTNATQNFANTTGFANGQTWYFGTANVTRTVSSFIVNTSVTFSSSLTTTTNETLVLTSGDRKMAFAMAYNDVPRRVKGIGVLRTANIPVGCTMDMNLSLWPNKINTNDWNPDTAGLVDSNAWGTVSIGNITGSVRAYIASLQATITLPVGYFWFGNQYQFTGGNSGTAGGPWTPSFAGVALTRLEGIINGATAGYGRYDQLTTTTIPYAATTPNAALSGKAFVDQSAPLATRAEGIDYFLWCDPV